MSGVRKEIRRGPFIIRPWGRGQPGWTIEHVEKGQRLDVSHAQLNRFKKLLDEAADQQTWRSEPGKP